MSDKTTITLYCSIATYEANHEILDQRFGGPTLDNHAEFAADDADYGMIRELEQMASTGMVFYGYHDNGHEYPPRVFAADGQDNRLHWTYTHPLNGPPIVAVQEDGRIDEVGLARVRTYLEVRQRAEQSVNIGVSP